MPPSAPHPATPTPPGAANTGQTHPQPRPALGVAGGAAKTTNAQTGMGLRQNTGTSYSSSFFGPSTSPFGKRKGKGIRDDEGFWLKEKPTRAREPQSYQRLRSTISTGTRKKLRVVPVCRFDVFVSRLHPDTTVDDIKENVRDIIGDTPVNIS